MKTTRSLVDELSLQEKELVLGLSFLKKSQSILGFAEFLRRKGHFVTLTRDYVRIVGLPGDLKVMARELSSLADAFDRQHGTLIANTLVSVWEFRNCCVKNDCEGDVGSAIWADVFAIPEFAATGEWKETDAIDDHRKLCQIFKAR